MKRILLGSISFLLAIASFITTKAMTRVSIYYIQTSVGSSHCQFTFTIPWCSGSNQACVDFFGRQYFGLVTDPVGMGCTAGLLKN